MCATPAGCFAFSMYSFCWRTHTHTHTHRHRDAHRHSAHRTFILVVVVVAAVVGGPEFFGPSLTFTVNFFLNKIHLIFACFVEIFLFVSLLLWFYLFRFVCLFYYKFIKAQVSPLFPYIFSVYQQSHFTYTTNGGPASFTLYSYAPMSLPLLLLLLELLLLCHCHCHSLTATATLPLSLPFVSLCALRDALQLNIPFWISETFLLVLRSFRVANAALTFSPQSFHTQSSVTPALCACKQQEQQQLLFFSLCALLFSFVTRSWFVCYLTCVTRSASQSTSTLTSALMPATCSFCFALLLSLSLY